eukprot:sb/3475174/
MSPFLMSPTANKSITAIARTGSDVFHVPRLLKWNPADMKWQFKQEHSLDSRREESQKIRRKYPDRIPVVVEKVSNSSIPDIDKRKFLVPSDLTVAQFMYIIRKRIQLAPEKAMFLFVNKMLPTTRLLQN